MEIALHFSLIFIYKAFLLSQFICPDKRRTRVTLFFYLPNFCRIFFASFYLVEESTSPRACDPHLRDWKLPSASVWKTWQIFLNLKFRQMR